MKDLKSYLTKDSTFFSKEIESSGPLSKILEKGLDLYTVSKKDANTPKILWPKERYNLQRSPFFMKLPPEIQESILEKITELNLSLSYFIEKSGHNYGAKMILLSDSIQEKSLFSLFAAEEAIHLKEFTNFINFTIDSKKHWHPMLSPLSKVIHEGEKNTCLYIIQVLLEGFGIGHYTSLKNDCLYQPLQNVFNRILKDEARHHGAGVVLVKETKLKKIEREQVFEYTRDFVQALRSANWVLNIIEESSSPLSKSEKATHYEAVEYEQTMAQRMRAIKEMLLKSNHENLVESLTKDGVFK